MQQVLNVDVAHIDRAARQIAADSGGTIQIIGSELISDDYLLDVMGELDRWLNEQEQVVE